jgi:hypothetical protein
MKYEIVNIDDQCFYSLGIVKTQFIIFTYLLLVPYFKKSF